jgi:tetratricopeptide (TPR) repeat protein
VLIGVGEYEKAKNVLQQILSESEDDEEKSKCYLLLGYGAYTGDDYETALGNYFKCLELQKKAHIDDVWIGQTYSHIAETYYWKDDFNLSFEFSEKALSLIPENHDLYSSAYRIMGNACRGKGDYQTALNCFQKALKIKKEKLPKDHDDIGITYNSLGATYEKMENYSEALECYTEAVRIHRITRPKTYGSIQGNEKNVKRIREKMQRQ